MNQISSLEGGKGVVRRRTFPRRHKPIEQVIQELAKKIPSSAWKHFPSDFPAKVDRYLYGLTQR